MEFRRCLTYAPTAGRQPAQVSRIQVKREQEWNGKREWELPMMPDEGYQVKIFWPFLTVRLN